MATYIKTLSDKDGNTVLPKSRSGAIYHTDNNTVENWLNILNQIKFNRSQYTISQEVDPVNFNNIIYDGIYEYHGYILNTPYGNGGDSHWILVILRHSDLYIRQMAFDVRSTNSYVRMKINGVWDRWCEMWNWASLNHASTINAVAVAKRTLSAEQLNDTNWQWSYEANVDPWKAEGIGLPFHWYHLRYYAHLDNNGYGFQIAHILDSGEPRIYVRTALMLTWSSWHELYSTKNIQKATSIPTTLGENDICLVYQE